ncbi:MAG: SPFH domain-containing protein [Candidatus Scalindua sp.]|nr:SPFH domain-containing protein [Candidatus Scalindua sp.]
MDKNFKSKGKTKKRFSSKLFVFFIPIIILIIIVIIVGGRRLTWKDVGADEVAVIINNITGKIKTINRAGAVIYYPYVQDLYILDKTEQTIPMTSANISKDFPEGNSVILKTLDGGDISLDLIIHFKLIPDEAHKIVQDTGTGDLFKQKWIFDYAKTICRYVFGELTLDEFPESAKREEKTGKAVKVLNDLLNKHGIFITSIDFIDYRYYREYAEKIQERRLADKEVEEQIQRQRAAEKNQERVVTEETKKLDVTISRYQGDLDNMEINAKAKAHEVRSQGVEYLLKAKLDADAEYDRLLKEAESILAIKKAEAEGLLALRNALEGAGGLNLVKMEYAKRLREAIIKGTPVLESDRAIPQLRERMKEQIIIKEEPPELAPAPPVEGKEKKSLSPVEEHSKIEGKSSGNPEGHSGKSGH